MDTMVTARVPAEVKKRATEVFREKGTTTSEAINAYLEYVAKNNSLPDLRSEEQIMFEGCERVLDQNLLTPNMRRVLKAMRAIENQPPIDWGESAGKPFKELLEEAREERHEALLGH